MKTHSIKSIAVLFLFSAFMNQSHCHSNKNHSASKNVSGTKAHQKAETGKTVAADLTENLKLLEKRVEQAINCSVAWLNNATKNTDRNEYGIQLIIDIVNRTYDLFLIKGQKAEGDILVFSPKSIAFLKKITNKINPEGKKIMQGIFLREQQLKDKVERERNNGTGGICDPLFCDSILRLIHLQLYEDTPDNPDNPDTLDISDNHYNKNLVVSDAVKDLGSII